MYADFVRLEQSMIKGTLFLVTLEGLLNLKV